MQTFTNSFSILLADDHTVVRQGVSLILKSKYPNSSIHQTGSFSETIKMVKKNNFDLIILDINFPDGNTVNMITELKKLNEDLKILMFSAFDEDIYAMRYLNAGANGYLNKLSSETEIQTAVETILNTGKYITPAIKDKILDSYIAKRPANPLESLGNREVEIARLLIKGYGNSEICNYLNLHKSTVSTYRNRLFEKLGINSVPELIQVFNLYFEE